MALTYTPPGELGSMMPEFYAKGINTEDFSSANLSTEKPTLVMFICSHCPYVLAIENRLIELGRDFQESTNVIAICSNDPMDYPEDSYENLKKRSLELKFPFKYLHDESQGVAKDFGAVCTPDLFLFDQKRQLVYRGRLDDSWKQEEKVSRQDLRLALEETIANRPISGEQIPSMGCSIKWKED